MKRIMYYAALAISVISCEVLDDEMDKHAPGSANMYVGLDEVAKILSSVPLMQTHLDEVHDAAISSTVNGYDEEYTMRNLFGMPGSGVGDDRGVSKSSAASYDNPLRDLIRQYVRESSAFRSSASSFGNPEEFLDALVNSDIQIYWPFSDSWDGETFPIITFDPEDGSDVNIGYRLLMNDDGSRYVEEVTVDEETASETPVWVVNRNFDAEYTTLEMLRREDPDWGTGGGTIIVKPESRSLDTVPLRTIILKEFTMHRNYDSWFAGASEFFVKTGSLDDFTASTEAEIRLFNPMVTDFMIVVKRNQIGIPQPFNAVLIPDWNPQMTHTAFMITEDDGGTRTEWKTTALVRVDSKSYGVEINLPFSSRDDVVWRGHITDRWLDANSGQAGRFGDIDLTFEVVEH